MDILQPLLMPLGTASASSRLRRLADHFTGKRIDDEAKPAVRRRQTLVGR
jgi:hypothetical protein